MREIKFRCFDKNEKCMLPWEHLVDAGDLSEMLLFGREENENYSKLMQYIGTSDQNDVDIYEGDIVKRFFAIGRDIYDTVSLGFVEHEVDEEGYFIGVVSYRPSNGFVLNQCRKYDTDYNLISKRSGVKIHAQYAEVIGNIYENPELLEESK